MDTAGQPPSRRSATRKAVQRRTWHATRKAGRRRRHAAEERAALSEMPTRNRRCRDRAGREEERYGGDRSGKEVARFSVRVTRQSQSRARHAFEEAEGECRNARRRERRLSSQRGARVLPFAPSASAARNERSNPVRHEKIVHAQGSTHQLKPKPPPKTRTAKRPRLQRENGREEARYRQQTSRDKKDWR